jgi:hypothetical protein
MGIRRTVGSRLESTIGRERTNALRRAERKGRNAIARRIAIDASGKPSAPGKRAAAPSGQPSAAPISGAPAKATAKPASKWGPSDPFVPHPAPTMSRHQLLEGLHERLQPRTYLEIGINDGAGLMLSRTRSIGVDPSFKITKPLHCDVQLVKATSDDFFADDDSLAHFEGVPVDLAFIDGMHLAEYAYRDFMNTEPLMADTGVVVFDDMLPRNGLEAARDRMTQFWAGDVYKVAEILRRRRGDLVVLLVNTSPTGTCLVVGVDQANDLLKGSYADELDYLTAPDPQNPPREFMDRSIAVDPEALLASPVWDEVVARRDDGDRTGLTDLWAQLRSLENG